MQKQAAVSFLILALVAAQRKPKETDDEYNKLIPIADVPVGCGSTSIGYAIVDGGLEKCDEFQKDHGDDTEEALNYEKFKCKHLRVHGELKNGKCQCKDNWQGVTCNEYRGCPEGKTLFNRVCADQCRHGGKISFTQKNVECICEAPWDGPWCDRLACWRMAPKEHERRWKNSVDKCVCAKGLSGENCDIVESCENGEFSSGRCVCAEGYKGETCAVKCTPGVTCSCSRGGIVISLFVMVGAVFAFFR